MNTHQAMVRDFMLAFGQNVPDKFDPKNFPGTLRASLIMEEANEFEAAVKAEDWIGVIDAICDLLYVVYGAANAIGVDVTEFFSEVHRSNMAKLGENGKPIYREDGKVIKPANWTAPQLRPILFRAICNQMGLSYTQQDVDAAS